MTHMYINHMLIDDTYVYKSHAYWWHICIWIQTSHLFFRWVKMKTMQNILSSTFYL